MTATPAFTVDALLFVKPKKPQKAPQQSPLWLLHAAAGRRRHTPLDAPLHRDATRPLAGATSCQDMKKRFLISFDIFCPSFGKGSSTSGSPPASCSTLTTYRRSARTCASRSSPTAPCPPRSRPSAAPPQTTTPATPDERQEPQQRLLLPPRRHHVQAEEVLHHPRCLQACRLGHREGQRSQREEFLKGASSRSPSRTCASRRVRGSSATW